MSAITPWKWGWGEVGEAVAFWGFVGRGGNPLAPKVIQPEAKYKVMHTDNKPKAVQVTNPFRVIK